MTDRSEDILASARAFVERRERLLIIAPDMLAALEALVLRLKSACCAGIDKNGGWPELKRARVVIAKARGES
jgi:hypothetical protein